MLEDLDEIIQPILAGDRIAAINIYISITGCGLTEAQKFIKELTAEVKSTEQEKHYGVQQRRRDFWHWLISSLK